MGDVLQHWWGVIVGGVTAVIWLVRLESRANQNTKDLAKLEERLAEQRREDLEMRARDWGRMESAIGEMRADIKKLLERNV